MKANSNVQYWLLFLAIYLLCALFNWVLLNVSNVIGRHWEWGTAPLVLVLFLAWLETRGLAPRLWHWVNKQ